MKNILLLLASLFAFNALATEVEIVSGHLGIQDFNREQTLCLTVVRLPNLEEIGIVEDIYDCFYAREAQGKASLDIELEKLKKLDHEELREHLQKTRGHLEFYFSDGE